MGSSGESGLVGETVLRHSERDWGGMGIVGLGAWWLSAHLILTSGRDFGLSLPLLVEVVRDA